MDQKKSNKISDIVRLQQILKKWRKLANAPKANNGSSNGNNSSSKNSSKSMKFLKKTLSFSELSSLSSSGSDAAVPKGYLAVCVGEEMKRFIIPTEYLGHRAFGILLREAEEEFGFQQEGVLRIPCDIPVFERILKVVEEKREVFFMEEMGFNGEKDMVGSCSSRAEICPSPHPPKPLCR